MTLINVASKTRGTRDDQFGALWTTHHVALTRLALGLTGEVGAAEELVQDAFVALMARWSQLRDPDAAVAYLRKVIVNGGRGRWRRLGRDRRVVAKLSARPDIARLTGASSAVGAVDTRLALLEGLARLSPGKRECVLLRHYVDLSEAEVADLLSISVGTVKSQTAKALRELAAVLDSSQVR